MSRILEQVNDNIVVIHGNDHAIGSFLDVTDKRYAFSGKDEQGEGYVFQWSRMFNTKKKGMNNLINLDKDKLDQLPKEKGINYIIECCDAFIKTLTDGNTKGK